MPRKKSGMQTAVCQWAYQCRKTGARAAGVLRSIEEVEKTLCSVRIKRK